MPSAIASREERRPCRQCAPGSGTTGRALSLRHLEIRDPHRRIGDVLRHGDVDRTRPAVEGDVDGLLEDVGSRVEVLDDEIRLGDGVEDLLRIRGAVEARGLVEAAAAAPGDGRIARDGEQRIGVGEGDAESGDEIERAGPGGGEADAEPVAEHRIAAGHERRGLLVLGDDRADAVRCVERQHHAGGVLAGAAEYRIDADRFQSGDNRFVDAHGLGGLHPVLCIDPVVGRLWTVDFLPVSLRMFPCGKHNMNARACHFRAEIHCCSRSVAKITSDLMRIRKYQMQATSLGHLVVFITSPICNIPVFHGARDPSLRRARTHLNVQRFLSEVRIAEVGTFVFHTLCGG